MKVKVPATSANLAVGFDLLGLSLNVFNTFEFTPTKNDHIMNDTGDPNNHLVLQAYKAFFTFHKRPHLPVTIQTIQEDIPRSRGLGSSATCILAGVFAANTLGKLNASFDRCVAFAADYEGHPDNVYPAAYGGLVATLRDEEGYYFQSFDVHDSFVFTLLIPDTITKTDLLRKALPDTVDHTDAVHNAAHVVHLPKAFQTGDLKLLKRLMNDRLHEPYRYPFIPKFNEIQELKRHPGLVVAISGSGSTILVISQEPIDKYLTPSLQQTFRVVPVTIGAKLELQ